MILEILVLRAYLEHFNQTLHSPHLILAVCQFVKTRFTQQITALEIMVLRVFREHFNQILHSHHLIFLVCYFNYTPFSNTTDNGIGDSGAESISRALQSNTSLTSLVIHRVLDF